MATTDKYPQASTTTTKPGGAKTSGTTTTGRKNTSRTGNPLLIEMFKNDATPEEISTYLSTGYTPASYESRIAAIPQTKNYALGTGPAIRNIDYYGISDKTKPTWEKIAELYNSGDTKGAFKLVNGLAAGHQYSGWYDDDGKYWGFAQGYTGGADRSYQPVMAGRIISSGLEPENTNIWLTPDGKAMHMGAGGALTDTGDTWSAQGPVVDPVMYNLQMRDDLANLRDKIWANDPSRLTGNVNPAAQDALMEAWKSQYGPNDVPLFGQGTDNSNGGKDYTAQMTWPGWTGGVGGTKYSETGYPTQPGQITGQGGQTPYQQMIGQYPSDGSQYPSGGQSGPVPGSSGWISTPTEYNEDIIQGTPRPEGQTPYQQMIAQQDTPAWEDPYQQKRDELLEAAGEKWGGSPYQQQRDEALKKAQETEWSYDPNTDPVWQAYQKQYRREGRRAAEDTLGRLAGMTGGMPSSYAATAAAQQGNYYASQLSDKLPQLYQDAYNRYLDEYKKQLGISDYYAAYDDTEYNRWLDQQGMNLDLADQYNLLGEQDYSRYRDTVSDQQNADETAYQRYIDERDFKYKQERDAVSDQQYDREWAQQLREYADEQNWKQTEWQQYLREYGDKLTQQEREWVYQQMRDAESDRRWNLQWAYQQDQDTLDRQRQARLDALNEAEMKAGYGDMSGLTGLGIDTSKANPKEVAYASDGSTYKFNTQDALYFVQNAPNGKPGEPTTMRGSDGSIWRKDEYGNVTIEKNGKIYTYSNAGAPAATGSTGSYRGSGSGSGSGNGSESTYVTMMQDANITSRKAAKAWLAMNATKLSDKEQEAIVDYYMEMRGEEEPEYSADDVAWARDIVNGKYPNVDPGVKAWAQNLMSKQYGMTFDQEPQTEENQGAGYRNFQETLNSMLKRGASRNEIFNEIDAEVKDKKITPEQGEALKNEYYGKTDNVENSGRFFDDGRPMSKQFLNVHSTVNMIYDKDGYYAAVIQLYDLVNKLSLHDYEINMILDELQQKQG